MQKIMVAMVKNIRERERLNHLLNSAEKADFTIHLFEIGKDEYLTQEQLDGVLIYLHNNFQVEDSVTLLSNVTEFLLSSYVEHSPFIKGYILFAEKGMSIPDFRTYVKQVNSIAKPISVFYKDWKEIIPLVLNYLPYVYLYQKDQFETLIVHYEQLFNPERSDAYKQIEGYLMTTYQIPETLLKLVMLQYLDNAGISNEQFQLLNDANQILPMLNEYQKKGTIEFLDELLNYSNARCKVAIWSVLFYLTKSKKYVICMLNENFLKQLQFAEKYSLYINIKRLSFVGLVDFRLTETIRLREIYNKCVDELASKIKIPKPIPSGFRNRNRVVIFTCQFLSMGHAPTRNVVDHAIGLKHLGKEVLIINSADLLNRLYVPILNGFIGNYMEQYSHAESINFNRNSFKFYQARKAMPNIEDAQKMIDIVRDFNPEFVLSMGESAVGDMCSQFTSVIAMNFAGNLPSYRKCYWAATRKPLPDDQNIKDAFKISEDQIFPIHFTFLLKEKVEKIKRKDLGIPENGICLCITGNRLDQEITETYLSELKYIINQINNSYILILGRYENYQSILKEHPALKGRFISLGYVNAVRAVYSQCNFYLNPPRIGGGSSAAEALLEGVPVITRKYGDVYYQLWLEQSFETKEEIVSYIRKCIDDSDFYQKQRAISKKKGESLYDVNDTNVMMKKLLKNADRIVYGE